MTDEIDRAKRLGMEPGSINSGWPEDRLAHQDEVAHSIAISLKRIADALDEFLFEEEVQP
jgi:hypothetical protein